LAEYTTILALIQLFCIVKDCDLIVNAENVLAQIGTEMGTFSLDVQYDVLGNNVANNITADNVTTAVAIVVIFTLLLETS
jgi:hypothetical protein